jgi:hypothetical protein
MGKQDEVGDGECTEEKQIAQPKDQVIFFFERIPLYSYKLSTHKIVWEKRAKLVRVNTVRRSTIQAFKCLLRSFKFMGVF